MSIAKKLIDTLKEDLPTARAKVSDSYIQLVALYPLLAITTKAKHTEALKVIEKLITFSSTSVVLAKDDGLLTYLNTLSELVSDYEKKHYSADKSTPLKGSQNMATKHYTTSDFEAEFGALTFGNALKSYRLADEKGQREFAKKLGITPQGLRDLEKGRKIPSVERAMRIAKCLREPVESWVVLALNDMVRRAHFDVKVEIRPTS